MNTANLNIQANAEGKYCWCYEVNLFRNPTILITLYKVFCCIIAGCGIGLSLIILASSGELTAALGVLKGFGIAGAVLMVLISVGYLIYAVIQGGKYCVVFEMDNVAVTHTQIAKQFGQAQIISALAAVMGAAKGSLTLMETGILAGCRASMLTKFSKVNRIRVKRRYNVIHLHSITGWNQIYATKETFDDVLSFILAQVPQDIRGE